MRDSRVTIFNSTVMNTGTTTVTGPDINLLDGFTWNGSYAEGTGLYGVGAEVMVSDVTLGTDADGVLFTFKWQVAPDSSGVAGTYVDAATIGVIAYDETNGFTKDGTLAGAALGLTRAKLSSRLRTTKLWARIACTSSDLEGTFVATVNGWLSDGTHPFADSGRVY